MKTVIYLIRHTEAEKNSKTINENLLLTHFGEACAEKLSKCVELQNLDRIYSSSFMRAKETAEYIAYENNTEVIPNSKFDERKIGKRQLVISSWKGKPYSYTVGQMLDENLKDEGGESRKEVAKRFKSGVKKVLEESQGLKKIAIVSHGAAIKYFLMNYCSLDENYDLVYNGRVVCPKKLEYPYIVKLTYSENKLNDITLINTEEK